MMFSKSFVDQHSNETKIRDPLKSGVTTTLKMGKRKVEGVPQSQKSKRKVEGVPQSQTAALSRPREEEETDKSKQAQTEQTYEKH